MKSSIRISFVTILATLSGARAFGADLTATNFNLGYGEGERYVEFIFNSADATPLHEVYFIINTGLSETNGCMGAYIVETRQLYIMNDDGNAWLAPNSTVGKNSSCSVTLLNASGGDGRLALEFGLNLVGKLGAQPGLNVYLAAIANSGSNTGWQHAASWTHAPVPGAPRANSAAPPSVLEFGISRR